MFDTGLMEEFLRCYRAVVEFKDMVGVQCICNTANKYKKYQAIEYPLHSWNENPNLCFYMKLKSTLKSLYFIRKHENDSFFSCFSKKYVMLRSFALQ